MLLWHTHVDLGGSIAALGHELAGEGVVRTIARTWGPHLFGGSIAWAMIAGFAALQLAFMRLLPGRRFEGPVPPSGVVPVYRANGVLAFALTLGLFALGSFGLHLFRASVLFDHLGDLLGALNLLALAFCLGLYF